MNHQQKRKPEYCEFCAIFNQHKSSKSSLSTVLNQNQQFFAFEDIQKSAQQHILVCTKEHIESALDIKQSEQLKRMQVFGLETLRKITKRELQNPNETRFCFHLPPHISEFHIHLHCFLLPFINKDRDVRVFGYLAKSVNQVIEVLKKKQHEQQYEKSSGLKGQDKQSIGIVRSKL